MSDGRLLTAREVGELVGATPATVLRWTRAGKLHAIRLPSGAIRYRETALEETLDGWATVPARPVFSVVPPTTEET